MWRRFSAVKRHVALMWQPRQRGRDLERGGDGAEQSSASACTRRRRRPRRRRYLCRSPFPASSRCRRPSWPCCPLRSAWLSHLVRRRHCRRHGRGCLPTPAMWWPTYFAPLWRATPSSAPTAAPRPHLGGACAPATMAARSARWWLPPPPRRSSAASTRTLDGRWRREHRTRHAPIPYFLLLTRRWPALPPWSWRRSTRATMQTGRTARRRTRRRPAQAGWGPKLRRPAWVDTGGGIILVSSGPATSPAPPDPRRGARAVRLGAPVGARRVPPLPRNLLPQIRPSAICLLR